MAYLPEFENDLLISYRRALNEGPDRWVTSFELALRWHLKRLVGDVAIWRDEEQMLTGDPWREKLAAALDSTAIYLAIISRTYLDSRECRGELDLMLDKLRNPAEKGQRQIFPIFMQPPRDPSQVPSELKGTQSRDFFESRTDTPLGFVEFDADCREFQQRLSRFAQEVTVALERLRGAALSRFNGRVFVADVPPGLYNDRDDLKADLFDRRFRALPEREYLWQSTDIERDIRADLDDAMLAVHLVSPTGLRSEAHVDRARRQLKLAIETMERLGRPSPIVWVSSRVGASAALQAFLNEIDMPFADEGVEVVGGGLGELKTLIYKRLPSPRVEPVAAASDDVVALVQDDEYEAYGAMRQHLRLNFDVETVPVRLQGDAARDGAALAKALPTSNRCLIFWGSQPEEWLQQILRLPQLGRHLGRERLLVLAAAPENAAKRQFGTRKASVVLEGAAGADLALRAFFGPAPTASAP